MLSKLKRILQYNGRICPLAIRIIKIGLLVSCLLLSFSLLIEVRSGPFTARTYADHYLSAELYRLPLGILLLSFIASAIINDTAN